MITDWKDWLRQLKISDIEARIVELKNQIILDQQEIVYLSIIRKGKQRATELKAISDRRAEEAINEAIEEINRDASYVQKTDAEGSLKDEWTVK